jgi:hypothetical protein
MSWMGEAWAGAGAGAFVSTAGISIPCTQPSAATAAAPASAAGQGSSGKLAVLALTGPLLQDLLQRHPHGGIREQHVSQGWCSR